MRIVPLVLLLAACPAPGDDDTDTGIVDTDVEDTGDTDDTDPCDEVPWYDDADEDGFGDPATEVIACEPEPGQVDNGDDCDDTLAAVNPGEDEVCGDGLDNDCDGGAPECRPEGTVDLADWGSRRIDGETSEAFGSAVALVPDVSGDGRADVLIGRPLDDRWRPGNGWVGLYTGVDSLDGATPSTTFRRRRDNENLGAALVGPGDLDGDGQNDLALAAPRVAFGDSEDVGVVHLLRGPFGTGEVDLSAEGGVVLSGSARKDQLGRTLAAPGDLDGDGLADLAVAATQPTGDKAGRVYLIDGDATSGEAADRARTTLAGGSTEQRVGEILAAVGDLDGDGTPEVVVGGGNRTGVETTLWWFSDPSDGTVSVDDADALLDGGDQVPLQQGVVDGAGDVDGDGYGDLWVGAPASAALEGTEGAVHLFLGPLDGTWSLDQADGTLTGTRERQYVGTNVRGAGDLDGDGIPDAAVVAIPLSGPGELLLVSGDLRGTTDTPRATLLGPEGVRRLGQGLDAGRDVDGDGLPDVLLGAPGFSGDDGEAWLVPGAGL